MLVQEFKEDIENIRVELNQSVHETTPEKIEVAKKGLTEAEFQIAELQAKVENFDVKLHTLGPESLDIDRVEKALVRIGRDLYDVRGVLTR